MATGTLAPDPWLTVENGSGVPYIGAKVYTYIAGTTTPAATYSDVGLTTPNANPIITDAYGRYLAFLVPGASYKFVVQDSTGAAIRTQDNILAVPANSGNIDVPGTAGEALTAGQVVYLSAGDGSKVSGSWYKADPANAYSSLFPPIGMVPASIASGGSGTVRMAGQMTGLTSLTIGTDYYLGTAGALSTTNTGGRRIGRADTTSTLIMPPVILPIQPWVNDFRLSLTTAVPVTTADVTAATTIYCTPYFGNRIDLPDTNGNPVRVTSAEFSIAVPATTSTMYDIFVYNNAGVATLELLAWTNATTRATAVVRTTNGRLLKSGDNTRMLLGSFSTTGVSGQTEFSATKRYLSNVYNRVRVPLVRKESTASWAYTTATIRQANASTANQVEAVIALAEVNLWLSLRVYVTNASGTSLGVGIGEDSTTTFSANQIGGAANTATHDILTATLDMMPAVGRHFYSWNEYSTATGTSTWFGGSGNFVAGLQDGGLIGWIAA